MLKLCQVFSDKSSISTMTRSMQHAPLHMKNVFRLMERGQTEPRVLPQARISFSCRSRFPIRAKWIGRAENKRLSWSSSRGATTLTDGLRTNRDFNFQVNRSKYEYLTGATLYTYNFICIKILIDEYCHVLIESTIVFSYTRIR